jgi:hypothetical protein
MSNQREHILALGALVAMLMVGCGGSAPRPEPSPARETTAESERGDERPVRPAPVEVEPAPPPPPPAPTVVAGESTPIEGAMPTLRITAPRDGATVRTGDVTVRITLRNWELASPEGPHVHLVLDDEPYIAIRDTSAPIRLNELVQAELGHELAEGTHVLRMFPSRGHHESVKDEGAFATVTFHYRHATEGFAFDASAPLLTYSRPKGCNPLGERVLLDFFVTNTTLAADGPRVRWSLDGASGEMTSWAPHWIENLGAGSHELRLTLVGADGSPLAGPFNDTAHTFTVAEACPE